MPIGFDLTAGVCDLCMYDASDVVGDASTYKSMWSGKCTQKIYSPSHNHHFTHKASVTLSVHAEANAHSTDWLMCVFMNEVAPPNVRS